MKRIANHTGRSRRACYDTHRKGTALLEFVMSIPLLATVIAGTFFFGWVMRNQQRVRIASRHVAWSHVYETAETANSADVDDLFFDTRGEGTFIEGEGFAGSALEDYVRAVNNRHEDAGRVVEEMITEADPPEARREFVESNFETNNDLWRKLSQGAIRMEHHRGGRTWRRPEWSPLSKVTTETLLEECDAMADAPSDSKVESALRLLYEGGW
jgi:hypothetical protein